MTNREEVAQLGPLVYLATVMWDDDQWCLLTFADKGTPWHEVSRQ